MVELLLNTAAGRTIATRIADPVLSLHVPHLADIEVTQALRRYAADGEVDPAIALEDLRSLDLERHAHEPLLDRLWAL